jgi:hypothetical protein
MRWLQTRQETFSGSGRPTTLRFHRPSQIRNQFKTTTINFEKEFSTMYYTDDALFPENMQPLIITAAPYAPSWVPGDAADIAVTWDEQVQAAKDCYSAGATVLHVHVRNPATGHLSTDFEQFNYFLGRLKEAVPKMILQVGGSI